MTRIYRENYKSVEKALDVGNFKLAIKIWKKMKTLAENTNNKYGLKGCEKLKRGV